MQTLQDFTTSAYDAGLRFRATPTDRNPHMDSWDAGASHWRCTLSYAGRRMSVAFSHGSAHTSPPSLADVLNCLALDASGFENNSSFADWCAEYGYDTDSRKAERIYKTIGRQVASLKHMLGLALYAELLWNTESL